MKTEKGLALFHGKPLVQHVIEAAKKITDNIIIITANTDYRQFGCVSIADELKDKGPLGGIYTGLIHTSSQKNLVLGCDMPFLSEKLLKELVIASGDEDVLLTENKGLPEPLCSLYDKECIPQIRDFIEQDQLKITDALTNLKTRVISFDKEDWFTGNELANINSIEELKMLENLE